MAQLAALRGALAAVALAATAPLPSTAQEGRPPPFGDTAGTVFDLIRRDDPSALRCLEPAGRGDRQIWDKRVDGEPVVEARLFSARFEDSPPVEIAVNLEFGAEAAQARAGRLADALGRLPTVLRAGVARASIHDGHEGFHAGTGQIVLYAGTMDDREAYDHLEESVFHEAVHATWDDAHRLAPGWVRAQREDGGFLTGYAASSPEREDLAETALFAFALLHHPDRLPPADSADTRAAVPHRIAYLARLLPPGRPLLEPARGGCDDA